MLDEEVKAFMVINFGECFKSTREKSYSKLDEEKNLRKVAEWFYNFLTTSDAVERYIKLAKKTPEGKIVIRSSSSDNCV